MIPRGPWREAAIKADRGAGLRQVIRYTHHLSNAPATPPRAPRLTARRLGLDTQHESIVLMHSDCSVAKSEGFAARAQIQLSVGARSAVATLYFVRDGILGLNEVGLSEATWHRLNVEDGAVVDVHHPQPRVSMGAWKRSQ